MGIDIHAFNFIRHQAKKSGLGHTLTIGRQSLSVSPDFIAQHIGTDLGKGDGYCEPLLKAFNATDVASIDFSDYENPTFVADLNLPVENGKTYDTVIDAGSLEHVFDTASAFRNVVKFCKVGGRVIHILPVNNLGGHGFWQFTSDLMYSIYSAENGFEETEVFYASGLDFSTWYRVPCAQAGQRTELVSVEPIVLLSVAKKVRSTSAINAVQPFYAKAWAEHDVTAIQPRKSANALQVFIRLALRRRGAFVNLLRNAALIVGLVSGRSPYSIKHPRFKRVLVKELF